MSSLLARFICWLRGHHGLVIRYETTRYTELFPGVSEGWNMERECVRCGRYERRHERRPNKNDEPGR